MKDCDGLNWVGVSLLSVATLPEARDGVDVASAIDLVKKVLLTTSTSLATVSSTSGLWVGCVVGAAQALKVLSASHDPVPSRLWLSDPPSCSSMISKSSPSRLETSERLRSSRVEGVCDDGEDIVEPAKDAEEPELLGLVELVAMLWAEERRWAGRGLAEESKGVDVQESALLGKAKESTL